MAVSRWPGQAAVVVDNTPQSIVPAKNVLLRPITLDASLIGQPLPWDVYTASGVLLAAEGMVIENAEQFQRLTQQSQFIQVATGAERPMNRLDGLGRRLQGLLDKPGDEAFESAIKALLEELRALYDADPDACLGLIRLMPCASPSVRHALQAALVVLILGRQLDALSAAALESTLAATLTMNIAALALHDGLALGTLTLNAQRRAELLAHPSAGAQRLATLGVRDPVWLEAVRQHHENLDGSGYPEHLRAGEIGLSAQLIRLADYYCAKLSSRHYRVPKSPEFALRALFGPERGRINTQLATLLLRRLGLYPPGTLVRLNNGETAVITRQSHPGQVKRAVSFLDRKGFPLAQPKVRDLRQPHFGIRAIAIPDPGWPPIDWEALWGYRP